ncbi:spore coat protein [Bacillus subtilis]|nr:spore coat protein [Bacillus inaquosorum]MCY9415936.1 spore coat protein [Bacillus inaquosorum]CAF1828877.1 Spore coat protein F [Bacillus subtilis]CAI6240083.1 spore coat protein [Bacillus subtilis]
MPLNNVSNPINAKDIPAFVLNFLITIKTSINNYTVAMTETSNPHLRRALRDQLDAAVYLHGELSELLMEKGLILDKQLQIDSLLSCREL